MMLAVDLMYTLQSFDLVGWQTCFV